MSEVSAKLALHRFEKAAVAKSWMGSQPPEDHHLIEKEYKQAKENLLKHLNQGVK
jgi:hypothetical protein